MPIDSHEALGADPSTRETDRSIAWLPADRDGVPILSRATVDVTP